LILDLAFVDRADIKQYIGHPSPRAVYAILSSCIKELMRAAVIKSKVYMTLIIKKLTRKNPRKQKKKKKEESPKMLNEVNYMIH